MLIVVFIDRAIKIYTQYIAMTTRNIIMSLKMRLSLTCLRGRMRRQRGSTKQVEKNVEPIDSPSGTEKSPVRTDES